MIKFIISILMVMMFVGCNWNSDDNGVVVIDNNTTNNTPVVASPVKPSVSNVDIKLVPEMPPVF